MKVNIAAKDFFDGADPADRITGDAPAVSVRIRVDLRGQAIPVVQESLKKFGVDGVGVLVYLPGVPIECIQVP